MERTADTRAVVACVIRRAGVTIITSCHIGNAATSGCRLAGVIGTKIAVIAVGSGSADTRAAGANISGGTKVVVVAPTGVCSIHTPGRGIAGIIGTYVVVIAIEGGATYTLGVGADVGGCTNVAIVAWVRIGHLYTSGRRIAGIVGARIAVVAVRGRSADTGAIGARVGGGTGVAVVAKVGVGCMDTSCTGITGIIGTPVVVVTIGCRTADTHTIGTGVRCGARIVVVAPTGIGYVHTPGCRVAGVIGAAIAVIAVGCGSTDTRRVGADV